MTPLGQRLIPDGPAGESPAERRHRTLTELKRTVMHHPAVVTATGSSGDNSRFRELHVTFDPLILGIAADRAALRIEWRPRQDPTEPAYFVFHYHDSTGRDFGWHREPNPHVDGLEHFQERRSPEQNYEYETAYFAADSPIAVLWEILGRIEQRVTDES